MELGSTARVEAVSPKSMATHSAEDAQIRTIKSVLLAYLDKHPSASDSLEGISRSWLADAMSHTSSGLVRAVEELCAEGRIEELKTSPGKSIFRKRRTA